MPHHLYKVTDFSSNTLLFIIKSEHKLLQLGESYYPNIDALIIHEDAKYIWRAYSKNLTSEIRRLRYFRLESVLAVPYIRRLDAEHFIILALEIDGFRLHVVFDAARQEVVANAWNADDFFATQFAIDGRGDSRLNREDAETPALERK